MFSPEPIVQQWLEEFVRAQGGVAGTVHRHDQGNLTLAAGYNIPPPVIESTLSIPSGKGMAGLALVRKIPVQTCNIQIDRSGDVRPGARAVHAQAAIALPVFDHAGDVRAVVGLAFAHEGEISEDTAQKFAEAASTLPG